MRKIYHIEGLDCANCARELEEYLSKDEGIEKAVIDFIGKKLFVTYKEKEYSIDELLQKILEVESGITLTMNDEQKPTQEKHDKTFGEEHEWLIIRLVVASIMLAFGYFWKLSETLKIIIFVVAYLCAGLDVLIMMVKNFAKKKFFTEYSLMSIATIGAFIIQEYPEAVLVMILYQIGELLQDASVEHSRNTIRATIALRSQTADVWRNDALVSVDPEDLLIDEIVEVKVGAIIPVDGVVISGEGTIDTSNLTGESVPINVNEGMEVLSGTVLLSGHITMRVVKKYEDSTANKVLELIEENGEKKTKVERFVSQFARIYTPVVFLVALLIFLIPPIFSVSWRDSAYRALIFLVISCPCAIVISVPLAYFVGMGGLAHQGIIVKGANYLDALREVKTIVCDKTGTLTKGRFNITKLDIKEPYNDCFLEYLAYAESISNHPIAQSVVMYYQKPIDSSLITNSNEISGQGVEICYQNHHIKVGNARMISSAPHIDEIGTILMMEVDGEYAGYAVLNDEIKAEASGFISSAHQQGMKVIMLTGDKKQYALKVAEDLHLDEVHAELLPADKVTKLENFLNQEQYQKVLYMGDGINDAPSITRADVGVAMGALGSDAAIEASDMVIMNDNIENVIYAKKVAHKVHRTAIFNIVMSLTVKGICYVLAVIGYSSMWLALLADVGVALIAILNSIMLNKRIKGIK